jgi:hypothetical protein
MFSSLFTPCEHFFTVVDIVLRNAMVETGESVGFVEVSMSIQSSNMCRG